ncbi:hypothetical protein N5P37_006898 [Trichoderma harzianum]|uniref:Uncharacterized protein n=2 Tax=Trichoderma harzianum TaxID=5544 RepID=A0A2T4A2E9_TRIHA|nr:hypothetical protein M431DRAFT_237944 [Trichoderma harzianum CBS 226.95]KAK0760701.1 hypothetical protein N5P37_006898 [Trichoderma harzianum]PKK53178.1 hypothetical protein CI102_1591 [Trichoderma harzianum]PTB51242.1 hypothetical protein M431DRAFT_237944 [Trichoderma harzianum CBS 226.95]
MWPLKVKTVYERLHGSEVSSASNSFTDGDVEKLDGPLPSNPHPRSKFQYFYDALRTSIRLFCLWIVLVTAWRTTFHSTPRAIRYEKQTLECGNTTEEAAARGCAFDLLSHNWVAKQCMDSLTESEYREYVSSPDRKMGPYPYFLDPDGKNRVIGERAFALLANGPTLADQHVYTTREEHLAHCKYLLRRTHRAAEGKVQLNDENKQFWHAAHCLEELSNPNKKPMDELNEGFYVGFAPCTIDVPV